MLVVATFIIALLSLTIYSVDAGVDAARCNAMEQTSGDYSFHWSYWTGCRVEVNGFWYDLDDVDFMLLEHVSQ